ncbi:DUF7144 family membrane protein [Streptomyces agglomeratus]|uniref:DUF7144 family membrane protein n=1 Tax=Streptomyces agglomeratus TaxID=285458 RepID=UPI00085442B9|nr:hypothetical protein [Streptomyces agglomeratus]OEJ50122.1 hypothetical protein BGK72_04470 [Streptomyces agglomeratus]
MTSIRENRTDTPTGRGSGLVIFAAVLLLVVGILDVLRGIMAIAEDDVFVSTPNYVFQFDLTSWGWIHLIFGALAICVSAGLFKAAVWARVVGVGLSGLLIIANFLSLPYYPVWSILAIAMYTFVIWGLCVVRRDEFYLRD